MTTRPSPRQTAVVIGGSMAGLLAARILSEHFRRVTIAERDRLPEEPEQRKGVPQGRHAHGLLASGFDILKQLFPGIRDELVADGGMCHDLGDCFRWYHHGVYKTHVKAGMEAIFCSRPLLERRVRARVLALPNVVVRETTEVAHLLSTDDRTRVTGVVLRLLGDDGPREQAATASLVVDSTGRGSRSGAWLEALGYARPPESAVRMAMGYSTRFFRRRPGDVTDAAAVMVAPTAPHDKRIGVLFPVEGDRWICTLGGWHGDFAPTDDAGYLEFARSLAKPDVYDVIKDAEPVSEVVVHRIPTNLRRHYDRMRRVPAGYLVLGDAVCSFNPIFGQGMTSAAMQALVLRSLLDRCEVERDLAEVSRPYFRGAARAVDTAWQVATGEDFRYPETEGKRPAALPFINAYVKQVQRACSRDPEVLRAFLQVMNLVKAPPSVMAPRVAWRVARAVWAMARQERDDASTSRNASSSRSIRRAYQLHQQRNPTA